MHTTWRFLIFLCCICAGITLAQGNTYAAPATDTPPVTDKVAAILTKVTPRLEKEFTEKGFRLGAPVFIRIFKIPGELEVWMDKGDSYGLFKTYPICDYSGYLGPKLHEGDWQSPEGFYTVSAEHMHPRSNYHLAFNIGYPNEYDRLRNRGGSNIMVHGNCSSMGCFAMNDYRMEEIYTLAHSALSRGQSSFAVHIFPFRLTDANMKKFSSSPWIGFWKNLKEGYDAFEKTGQIPEITVAGGRYIVTGTVRVAMGRTEVPATPFPEAPQSRQ